MTFFELIDKIDKDYTEEQKQKLRTASTVIYSFYSGSWEFELGDYYQWMKAKLKEYKNLEVVNPNLIIKEEFHEWLMYDVRNHLLRNCPISDDF